MDKKKVVVIGAGLSGLVAAYRIEKDKPNELDVTVLEENSYPGGRMYTTSFGGEGGGESIGFYYSNLHTIAKEVGVEVDYAPMTILNQLFNIAYYWKDTNEWVQQKDWDKWANNPLPNEYRNLPPIVLLRRIVSRIPKPKDEDLLDDPQMRKYAGESLLQFLQEENIPPSTYPFIESNFEIHDLNISAFGAILKTWVTEQMGTSRYYYIRGGNQNLPRGIAAALKDVQYNKKVISVKRTSKGQHEITTEDGAKYIADYVVFALPVNPMKDIKIEPPLEGIQKEAFDSIKYTPSIKTFFKVKKPFWEEDKLPLFMWTDTVASMVIPVYDPKTRENPLYGPTLWGLYTVTNGQKAMQLYELEKKGISIGDHVKGLLEKMRPSMKGALEFVEAVDWGKIEGARGAFHYYLPTPKILDYYKHIADPSLGRFFAGEHTQLLQRGFEAATSAGLRAANEVMEEYVNKKVAIIGSGSLVGSLAEEFKKEFFTVNIITTSSQELEELSKYGKTIIFKENDTRENEKVFEDLIAKSDVIINLLSPKGSTATMTPKEIEKYYTETVLEPTKKIVKIINKNPAHKPLLIFVSTANVYGTGEQTPGEWITEEVNSNPITIGDKIYLETEKACQACDSKVAILRFGFLYDNDKSSISHIAHRAAEKLGFNTQFEAEGYFLKLHIKDAVCAITFVINHNLTGIYNICEGRQEITRTFFDKLCTREGLSRVNHLGWVKSPHKKVSNEKIEKSGFCFGYPKALVIGSGELSSHFIPKLIDLGYHVELTTTKPEKLEKLKSKYPSKASFALLEGKDAEKIQKLMEDKELVIVAVAPIRERVKTLENKANLNAVLDETYKTTTQNITKGWQKNIDKPKVVYIGAQSIYPNTDGQVVTEETPVFPHNYTSAVLKQAESNIIEWIPDSIALRLGWLLNPAQNWEVLMKDLVLYEFPGDGKIKANFVHIEDAARAVEFVIDKELCGIYNVVNEAHPFWGDLFDVISQQLGIKAPRWNLNLKDQWFQSNHIVSSQKIKEAGFVFLYPKEMGLSFIVKSMPQQKQEHLISAMITAWVRALEDKNPNGLFKDPYAVNFTNMPALDFLCVRTSLFDQEIINQVKEFNKTCQIVMLGAGMDTRAFRLEVLSSIPFFELDLPMVSEAKRSFIKDQKLTRANHHLIGADLSESAWMESLKRVGYSKKIPTIWILEGFLTYINEENAANLLRNMNKLSLPGSVVIVDMPKRKDHEKGLRIELATKNMNDLVKKAGWASLKEVESTNPATLKRLKEADQKIVVYRAEKKHNILIIGCGFFGTNFTHEITHDQNYSVYASTTSPQRVDAIKQAGAQEVFVWDGSEQKVLKEFLKIADTVIVSMRSAKHKDEEVYPSFQQLSQLIEPHQHLILLSSIEAYSNRQPEVKEEDADEAKIYTKIENLFKKHPNSCVIRLGQLFGKGIQIEPEKLKNYLHKEHMEKIFRLTSGVLPGDGNIPMFLTHLKDVIAFVKKAIKSDLKGIYNLCYTLPHTQKEFYDILCDHYGKPKIHWNKEQKIFGNMMLPEKIDISRLKKVDFNLEEKNYSLESIYKENS